MNRIAAQQNDATARVSGRGLRVDSAPSRARQIGGVAFLTLLVIVFARDLYALAFHAAGNELHSHILLVPFISAYLISIERAKLPRVYRPSVVPGFIAALAGVAAVVWARVLRGHGGITPNDYLSLTTLALILLLVGGGFFFLGARWMRAAAFPICFLVFAIPLPDHLVDTLETASKLGSAEAADILFTISGTSLVRDGLLFQLPGISLEVAQECSGIRSSWVLLITSVLASYLFLKSPWRRLTLVLVVIPLGLIRNGFRILVIGLLCVHISPDMVNSIIHRRGGPVFFVLSLIPLFGLLWWLRRGERTRAQTGA